jgi:hypothetical protein
MVEPFAGDQITSFDVVCRRIFRNGFATTITECLGRCVRLLDIRCCIVSCSGLKRDCGGALVTSLSAVDATNQILHRFLET